MRSVEELRDKVRHALAAHPTSGMAHVTLDEYDADAREAVFSELVQTGYVVRSYTSHGQALLTGGDGWQFPCDCWVVRPLIE